MFNLLKNTRKKNINKYQHVIDEINQLEDTLVKYSDDELKKQTRILKNKLQTGQNINQILPEAFATAKEATRRVLNLKMFNVQLLGGIILHEGKIAEMKTGEGKTIVSILPAYLHVLQNLNAHIITVNDYLAKRDAESVGRVYQYLGLTVGLIQQGMSASERKEQYQRDIVYVTNSELGFDYLRDNMAIEIDDIVQQQFHFGIIDEVDSILIDEARTPLIISGPSQGPTVKYQTSTEIAYELNKNIDYEIDEKARNITLTEKGIGKCEKLLKIDNLYSIEDPWTQYIINALKAKELFLLNQHYIIRNNEIIIVDEFTGRIMEGRRWSDGLHQAIEAKEKVRIQQENQTLASITYQNLFLLYTKLAGMTGTAKTEETELDKIYNLEVIEIPTNKPCIRKELNDLVYKNEYNKWLAIANECYDMYQLGRPTLVGTTNVEKSELLAKILDEYKIPYNLLNAKPENIARESEIISQAGRRHAITISTNMAGRGTDIILGGNASMMTKIILKHYIVAVIYDQRGINQSDYLTDKIKKILQDFINKQTLANLPGKIETNELEQYIYDSIYALEIKDTEQKTIRTTYNKIYNIYRSIFEVERASVIKLGGLHVIGTERHESRRIDNQLRGRAGRQGDPGSSRFFLSLEDNLLRIFGGNTISRLMENLNIDDDTPIESSILSKSLDAAQKKVESYFYDVRKQLFDYDEVINHQRQAIYAERKRILQSNFTRDCIIEYAESTIDETLNLTLGQSDKQSKEYLFDQIYYILNLTEKIEYDFWENMTKSEIKDFLYEQLRIGYDLREGYLEQLRPGLIRQLEKYYLLQQIDKAWQEHLERMTTLRESIGWRSYGQQDPLIEYKNEAFNLFINMVTYIRQTVVYLIMRSRLIVNQT